MRPPATVTVLRGGHPESEHRVVWCLTDAGATAAEGGEGAGAGGIFVRSAVKPFQALPAVLAGVPKRFGLGDPHLAIACASHGGDDGHVARVREILAAAGMTEDDLACGAGEPRDPRAGAVVRARGEPPARVRHNCSGKHALVLALCVAEGWPTAGYLDAVHRAQRALGAAVCDAAGLEAGVVPSATDGCGMCTFRLPLERLAAAFGRLAGGGLGDAGARLAAAMCAHPSLVSFDGAIDTELMAAHRGVVAKVGAEGVLAIGTPDGRGLALKVLDGSARAVDPAAVALAREVLGLAAGGRALELLARPPVVNSRGEAVGELSVVL